MATDMHAFDDLLKAFEDLTVYAAALKQRGWKVRITDLATAAALISEIKEIIAEVPDLKKETADASAEDWQKVGARAIGAIVGLLKAVT